MKTILIIGSGISGLSAALTAAKAGERVFLVAPEPSERSQSVMAMGGINAATIGSGIEDSTLLHREESMAGGCNIASPSALKNLCEAAPDIIRELEQMGVVFSRDKEGNILTRAFGGQSRKRTIFCGASTGKQIVSALNRQLRYYESAGNVVRLLHTHFLKAAIRNGVAHGAFCLNELTGRVFFVESDAVILACGGQNQLFGKTTGSTLCDGGAAAAVFRQGVTLKNLEMIQYHPTTIETPNKRMLITEAARGEGGRLFYQKNGKRVYFMEEKYGARGNLMLRDVLAREIYLSGEKIFLDISFLSRELIESRLLEVKEVCEKYLGLDVTKEPIPIAPSVHFFMGGIAVDENHQTNVERLYAVGECAAIYHGANRLGGNSLLSAIYSGQVAVRHVEMLTPLSSEIDAFEQESGTIKEAFEHRESEKSSFSPLYIVKEINRVMNENLGIARTEVQMRAGLAEIEFYTTVAEKIVYNTRINPYQAYMVENYLTLSKAILLSALARKESRGAHFRTDFPEVQEAFQAASVVNYQNGQISVGFKKES